MPQAVRLVSSIPTSYVPSSSDSQKADSSSQFIAVALFSGIGLFVSLVAISFGVQGVWF
jgi:hypothetical protein